MNPPGETPERKPATPPPPPTGAYAPIELEGFDTRRGLLGRGRGRRIALAVGLVGLTAAIVVGVRVARHETAPAAPPKAAPLVAPAPIPAPAPAPPVEIALDPDGRKAPPAKASAAHAADEAPATAPDGATAPAEHHHHHERHHGEGKTHEHASHERAHHERAAHHAHTRAVATKGGAGDREGARAAYQRGNALLLSGNAAGAVAAYQEAVRLAPSDPIGYRGLGLAYEKQGNTADAVSALVSYLKLSRHARDREVIARRLYRLTHPQDQ